MSAYFVRHIHDTPSASRNPAGSTANTTPANNEVRKYFTDNRTVHTASRLNEIPSANSKIFTSDGMTFKRINGGNTVEVVGLASASSAFSVVVPPVTSFLGLEIVKIGNEAFKNASRLRTIMLPASIKEIGDRAFAGSMLESITLLPSIDKLGKECFAGCTNLVSIDMSGSMIEVIEDKALMNCPSLKKVSLPETLRTMGNSMLENAFAIESINLPDSVTSIGDRVFYNCRSLNTLKTGANLAEIGKDAFGGCVSLSTITPCEYLQDNVQCLLKDTALYKSATYENGVKVVLGTVLDVIEPTYKFYKQRLPDVQVIAPYAFINCTQTTVELPDTIRLLMPNALVQRERVKMMDNGIVKSVEGLAVKMKVVYCGSVDEWRAVTKLHAEQRYPVCVTCNGTERGETITFIDYL